MKHVIISRSPREYVWTLDDMDIYGKSRSETNRPGAKNDALPATIPGKYSDGFPFRKELQLFVFDVMCMFAPKESEVVVASTFGTIYRSWGWTTNRFGTDWCADYINNRNLDSEDPKWQTLLTSHNWLEFLEAGTQLKFRSLDATRTYSQLMADIKKWPQTIYTPTVSGVVNNKENFDKLMLEVERDHNATVWIDDRTPYTARYVRPFGFLGGHLKVPILTWGREYNVIENWEARRL